MPRMHERAADGLYLIAIDRSSGRRLIGPRLLGLGMAAGLIGEMFMSNMIALELVVGDAATGQAAEALVVPLEVQPGLRRKRHDVCGLSILDRCSGSYAPVNVDPAAGDRVRCFSCDLICGVEAFPDSETMAAWNMIAAEAKRQWRSIADWLTVLAPNAPAHVADRLERDEWLIREDQRAFLSRRVLPRWVPRNIVDADTPRQSLIRLATSETARPRHDERFLAALVDAVQLTRLIVADLPDPDDASAKLRALAADLPPVLEALVEATKSAADDAVVAHAG